MDMSIFIVMIRGKVKVFVAFLTVLFVSNYSSATNDKYIFKQTENLWPDGLS